MVTHPSLVFSTSKPCIYAPLLQGYNIHRAAVSNEAVCGVLSSMVLVRLIEAFNGDARADFSQARHRKGAH